MKSAPHCLGLNIKTRRKQLRITQEYLAELTDLSKNSVQAIESGRQWPSPETIKKLAKALKTRETMLFYDPDLELSAEQALAVLERLVRGKR